MTSTAVCGREASQMNSSIADGNELWARDHGWSAPAAWRRLTGTAHGWA